MIPVNLSAIALSLLAAAAEPSAVEPQGALGSLEAEQTGLFARVAPSVVLLMRDGASGSGFVVAGGGLILTNAHVVGDGDAVTVQLADGRHGSGHVIARATGALDLALVRAPFDDLTPLAAGDLGAVRAGTFAATVGHGGGAAWTFSTGLVANPRPLGDGAPLLLAQMALRPGSSGGPLVDRLGRALAVVTAGTRDASGVTFAIRIDAAAAAFPQLGAWARGLPDPIAPASAQAPPARDPAEAAVVFGSPEPSPGVARLSSSAPATEEAPRMVTVWEAPRAARRAPSPAAAREASASGARAEPAPTTLPRAWSTLPLPLALAIARGAYPP